MFHEIYQNIPLNIDPIAFSIGSFSIRWYGFMYLAGFVVAYLLLIYRINSGENVKVISHQSSVTGKNNKVVGKKNDRLRMTEDYILVLDFLLLSFFAALIGGRIGYVLFYNLPYYIADPVAVISPYNFSGEFIGLFGMSFHGALLAIIIGSFFYLKKKSISLLDWADFVAPAATLGYFFGRMGNFFNGELYGRLTDSPLGMYFVADPLHLRHPSQLYEALLEGILLFSILWKMRRSNLKRGFLFGTYLFGYGALRIFVEQFREPDVQLGFAWHYLTMGQLLSFLMVIAGLFLLISKNRK